MNAHETVCALLADIQALAKTEKNLAQNWNFRGIEAVTNVVGTAIRKHGGFLSMELVKIKYVTVPGKNGGSLDKVRGVVKFNIYGSDKGEPVTGIVPAEANDYGDKGTAKMMSVALRTFLLQLLLLPTGEPDPDSFSHEQGDVPNGAPSVSELKAKISGYFTGQPKSAITVALENHTGKNANWSAHELAGYLYTLEGSK